MASFSEPFEETLRRFSSRPDVAGVVVLSTSPPKHSAATDDSTPSATPAPGRALDAGPSPDSLLDTSDHITREGTRYWIVHSTLPGELRLRYATLFFELVGLASSAITSADPTDELAFMRVRTAKWEFLIATENEYVLIVLQSQSTPKKG
ncbi:hypothetical protein H696_00484 [Fonticula alba]|uniref:Roadblock/LAMTOR2 domain-containing protein n=1 Tax=Fonticula alba TaxID=691883 RepID=A0A058ZES8_FONAL|nr:hypothetical protein H696_00484 [Fonticula alba]KCV72915.1 hypothetical protein H696_00484 [Fonticula alba]|eukprot:XP_009492616.1 hypothetical protein H696_00484 [Fonticula alba]